MTASPSASAGKSATVRLAHRLGGFPSIYSALRSAMGGDRYWRSLVHEVAQIKPGMRVLDVGCGPARVIKQLPAGVEYVGVDHNVRCIAQAQRRFAPPARFVVAEAASVGRLGERFDVVFAMGILHHLCDLDCRAMLDGVARLLAPQGRLVTADVVEIPDASPSASWLLSRDRGDHVRDERGYGSLLNRSFAAVESALVTDLLRVPLTGAPYPLLVTTASVPIRTASPQLAPSAVIVPERELAFVVA